MHNHSNEVFRCRKSMQSPKNRNLICKKNLFIFQMIMTKITGAQCHMMTISIQSLRKIHWKIVEKNSGQNRTDGQTDGQTDNGEVIPKCHLCLQQVTQSDDNCTLTIIVSSTLLRRQLEWIRVSKNVFLWIINASWMNSRIKEKLS